jgi:hypothetical protein
MRQLVSGLTLFVTMCLLAPVSDARAPKPPNFTGASVQFRDDVADQIRSDGGPYVDGGQRGLEVRMWINGSQDLTIGTFSSGRTLYFDYSDKVPGSGSGPTGTMSDNAFVNIRDIAAMGIGERRTTKASFNTAIGYLRWLGSPVPEGGSVAGAPFDSEAVVVERTSAQTWEIYTPVPSDTLIAPGYTAGDRNVLLKTVKNTLTPIGNYHMAFGLTVTCTTCP